MHVVNLSRALGQGPFRTRLIAGSVSPTEGDMAYYARERGVAVTELPRLQREMSPTQDLAVLWALFRLFRRDRPHIVHTHTAKAGALGRVAAALAGVPVRIHTFHGHVLGGGYFSEAKTRFYVEVERLLGRVSSRLVVLSNRQAGQMSEDLAIASRDAFEVIPLGLELADFVHIDPDAARRQARAALGLADETLAIAIVGRLVPVKNHELVLDAMSLLRDKVPNPVRLFVVGGGERERELRTYAAGRGVSDHVEWLGWRGDLAALYPAMDALALTSFDEGTPVAIIEALVAGTPVVARAVAGCRKFSTGEVAAASCPRRIRRASRRRWLPCCRSRPQGPRAAPQAEIPWTAFPSGGWPRTWQRCTDVSSSVPACSPPPQRRHSNPSSPSVPLGKSRGIRAPLHPPQGRCPSST